MRELPASLHDEVFDEDGVGELESSNQMTLSTLKCLYSRLSLGRVKYMIEMKQAIMRESRCIQPQFIIEPSKKMSVVRQRMILCHDILLSFMNVRTDMVHVGI